MTKTTKRRGRPPKKVVEIKTENQLMAGDMIITESQKESIKSMRDAVRKVLIPYRDLAHPDIGDVIALDDAFVNFYHKFAGDLDD